jgi:anti-anti-sigma factor
LDHVNPAPGHRRTQLAQRVPDHTVGTAPQLQAGPDVTATVAGHDGTVLCRLTRHREPATTGRAHPHKIIVVSVDGDLDADTSPLLHLTLTQALDAAPGVCCDLSRVAFFGAAGANTLLAAHLRATETGRHFTVRGVRGITRLVLGLTGLEETLNLTATRSTELDGRGAP